MRKVLVLALAIAALGIATSSFAGTSLECQISVTVRSASVDISTGTANNLVWGVLGQNLSVVGTTPNTYTGNTPCYQVVNTGYSAINLSLYQVAVSGWTMLTTGAPGATRSGTGYRLFGAFSSYGNTTLASAQFGSEDILIGTATTANATVGGIYALAGEGGAGGNGAYLGGNNVIPEPGSGSQQYQGTRTIQFCLDTPFTADGTAKTLDIFVGAVVH